MPDSQPDHETCPCGCGRSSSVPKVHGIHVRAADDDHERNPEGKSQWWCPRGFVHVRSREEPGRWQSMRVHATVCGFCKNEVIDLGMGTCPYCSGKLTGVALPPVMPDVEAAKQAERMKDAS